LLGMAEAYQRTKRKKYLASAVKAANWLCGIQESDGSWLKFTFSHQKHTYHSRVAWGLLEVYRVSGNKKYKQAGIAAIDWSSRNQLNNGWFTHNELQLPNGDVPFTHTISYAAEGFLWSGILLRKPSYIAIAERAVRPIAEYFLKHTYVPASFDQEWHSTDRYSCLTGNAQLSLVWGALYERTRDTVYLRSMKRMNQWLKQLQDRSNPNPGVNGAIKGSHPIYGDLLKNQGYCRMAYLNWATKFFVDALLLEEKIAGKHS
jgi:rhamnogalacturonyl hydrolase YesR